jgi:hypothetical protein
MEATHHQEERRSMDDYAKKGWGNAWAPSVKRQPPPPEINTANPRCKCGWYGEREVDKVWYCFRHYEEVTGLSWDR